MAAGVKLPPWAVKALGYMGLSAQAPAPTIKASSGRYMPMFGYSYNGEKNMGELGPLRNYVPSYSELSMRSWQSYLDSEISQTVLNKFVVWIIGGGLKLAAEPAKVTLQTEGIKVPANDVFNEHTEARFSTWAKSTMADYAGMQNLNLLAGEAFKNAIIGGDVLVVLRVKNGQVNIQLIDGAHLCSPNFGTDTFAQPQPNGNVIRHGVEMAPNGQHVAYHVRTDLIKYERIEARSKATGLVTAYLVPGLKYRLDNTRGIPLISAVLETLKKLERYKEATVGTAEELSKIAYQITHGVGSTGENPLISALAAARDNGTGEDLPTTLEGEQLANKVAATTSKQAINMPKEAKVEPINKSTGELYFKEFYETNINLICAAIGIPPNVAMSLYNDSFSASRAATKDWEHTISVNRETFTYRFYMPIYTLWLHVEILKNKINAPGYLDAFYNKNETVLQAWRNCRFTGAMFPHIDPVKEVNAERLKLGKLGENIPLTTVEAATEALGGGDSDANASQFAEELKQAKTLGLTAPLTEKNSTY